MRRNNIVIIGAGLAGLFAALKLSPKPVTIVSSARLGEGASSSWAQGGIAAAIEKGDSPLAHALDTMTAGAGIVNPYIANLLANEAAARVEDLLSYGVPFDKNLEGDLLLSREAAHSARRIVRVKGDRAGWAIMRALIKAARAQPNIQFVEGFTAKELKLEGNRVEGVHVWSPEGEHLFLPAKAVVLSAGGIGALYRTTTNPPQANGEALGMAARAGAVLADTEFVQFHPTAVKSDADPAPLATEALRGEGAVLVDGNGRRFMKKVHNDAELAPRDIVARAVFRQNQSGKGAFLDCRKAIGAAFEERFPTVFEKCMALGINPENTPIPVAPAAHFHMGGVLTDAIGRTSLEGLWACGEVASTGAHGANRLASNSLLEAVVFAARVAEDLNNNPVLDKAVDEGEIKPDRFDETGEIELNDRHHEIVSEIRQLMDSHVGLERSRETLVTALRRFETFKQQARKNLTLKNILTSARIVTLTALQRRESRGSHFRTDFPEPRRKYERRTMVSLRQVDEQIAKYVTDA